MNAVTRDGPPERSNGTGKTHTGVGSTVTLAAPDGSGKFVKFTLVESRESDPFKGRVSVEAPIAGAVVGCEVGEEVVVPAPRGERRYRIIAGA